MSREFTLAVLRASPRRPTRRRVPRQVPPDAIAREYVRSLLSLVDLTEGALAPLFAAMPRLLESAARDRSDSAARGVRDIRQDAGEGREIDDLIAQARAVLERAVRPDDLERLAGEFAGRVSGYNRVQLGRQVKAAIGVDIFASDAKVPALARGFVTENVALIKSIPAEIVGSVEKAVTRAVASGTRHEALAKEIRGVMQVGEDRARLIARDQVGKLYGQLNAARSRDLGATRFIWRTVHDRRVRPRHVALDGKTFTFADGAPGEGLPGEPILCRCFAEPILSDLLAELDAL